jgi:Cu2+-exporting ATPase
VRHARRQGVAVPAAADINHDPRFGVVARVEGRTVQVGTAAFLANQGLHRDPHALARADYEAEQGNALAYVAIDGQLAGYFAFQDAPRRESAQVVTWLRAHGVPTIHLVTGDGMRSATITGRAVGITDLHADALPSDKAQVVERLRTDGHVVAFVGDGLDDAAAMAMADASITFAIADAVTQQTADVVLLERDLRGVIRAIELARARDAMVDQNLTLTRLANPLIAFGAATGRLDATASAALSAVAASLVEANSLRPLFLRRQRHPRLAAPAVPHRENTRVAPA